MSANNNFETFKHVAGPPDGVTPVRDNPPLSLRLVFKILNTFGREGSQLTVIPPAVRRLPYRCEVRRCVVYVTPVNGKCHVPEIDVEILKV